MFSNEFVFVNVVAYSVFGVIPFSADLVTINSKDIESSIVH